MLRKLDLVIWTYNGSKKLEKTLPRIDEVIPSKVVRKKIASDDHSTDDTVEILKQHGWAVHLNQRERGVGYNANNALLKAKTEFVSCFEQDLLLARNWWAELSKELYKSENNDVALFVGLRLPNHPVAKTFMKYRNDIALNLGEPPTPMDNTILRMKAVRQVGGLPFVKFAGMDTLLRERFLTNGWRYLVKSNVVSVHLRESLKEELNHFYGYFKTNPTFDRSIDAKIKMWTLFMQSPFAAIKLALKTRDLNMLWYYPLVRKRMLQGFLDA